jgi:hypothetical protein
MRTRIEQAIAAIEAAEKLTFELQDLIEVREGLQALEAKIAAERSQRAKNSEIRPRPKRRH